jgi:hypothetical protein
MASGKAIAKKAGTATTKNTTGLSQREIDGDNARVAAHRIADLWSVS